MANRPSIASVTKNLKDSSKFSNFGIWNKSKINSPALSGLNEVRLKKGLKPVGRLSQASNAARDYSIKKIAEIYNKNREVSSIKREIQKHFGISSTDFDRLHKIVAGTGLTEKQVKEMEKQYGMNIGQFSSVQAALKGADFTDKDQKKLDKLVQRLKSINLFQTKRSRDESEGGSAADRLLSKRRSKESILEEVTTTKDAGGRRRVSHMDLGIKGPEYTTSALKNAGRKKESSVESGASARAWGVAGASIGQSILDETMGKEVHGKEARPGLPIGAQSDKPDRQPELETPQPASGGGIGMSQPLSAASFGAQKQKQKRDPYYNEFGPPGLMRPASRR